MNFKLVCFKHSLELEYRDLGKGVALRVRLTLTMPVQLRFCQRYDLNRPGRLETGPGTTMSNKFDEGRQVVLMGRKSAHQLSRDKLARKQMKT